MKPSEYQFDLVRIFIGEYPVLIYFEILLRVLVLYAFTISMMRIINKRGASQLSFIDVVLIIALGSAVGDPFFYPEVPVLFGVFIISLIIGIQRIIYFLSEKIPSVHEFFDPKPILVITNGKIDTEKLKTVSINKEDIYMQLRLKGIQYLDEIEYGYLESSGKVSVFKKKKYRKKTSILP
jgi:uncharacterized membrane protein YcaP (DUF421 family)